MMTVACRRSAWSTNSETGQSRYDAWVQALNQNYGRWDAPRSFDENFGANIETLEFGQFRIVECICDPCAGEKRRPDLAKDPFESLTIQLVLAGKEFIEFDGREYVLNPGDIFVWDNAHTMKFDVQKKLHKVSAVLPLHRFREWVPSNWQAINRSIAGDTPNAFLMRSHLLALLRADYQNVPMSEGALTEATIALLLGAGDESLSSDAISNSGQQLKFLKSYIEDHLKECSLSVASIANDNQISIRYLHWLFHRSGDTCQQYIIRRRLERCRQDIGNKAMSHKSLTQIAYSWGFSDSAHFSKRFKSAFGTSPSEYRKSLLS
ncbi:MAG: helix-turn-helix domain-containing protein [Pseudomonadota bacterium]